MLKHSPPFTDWPNSNVMPNLNPNKSTLSSHEYLQCFYLSELGELGVGRVVRDEELHALVGDLDRGRTVHVDRLEGRKLF